MKASFLCLAIFLGLLTGSRAEESALWGARGEKWVPGAPLKDFSHAGYCGSDAEIPDFPVGVNVRDFGAVGDGTTDDAPAFAKAIAACPPNSAVFVPDGTYALRDWLRIERPGLVLRGQSRERTVLFFPVGLGESHPNFGKTTTGQPTSEWSWSGGLIWFETASEVGIEDFTLKFPEVPYPGHFKEAGSNGVNFFRCANAWARRLTFINADSGIYAHKCTYVTFQDFVFDAYPGRATQAQMCGHHGVDFTTSWYCLMDGAIFHLRFLHELGIEHGAAMNVYMNCAGPDLRLDHHQTDVHDNLWTNIEAGKGGSLWENNAHVILKSRAGSTEGEVYWNVRTAHPVPYPEPKYHNLVVGLSGAEPSSRDEGGAVYESIPPASLMPSNLFDAQLALRYPTSKR